MAFTFLPVHLISYWDVLTRPWSTTIISKLSTPCTRLSLPDVSILLGNPTWDVQLSGGNNATLFPIKYRLQMRFDGNIIASWSTLIPYVLFFQPRKCYVFELQRSCRQVEMDGGWRKSRTHVWLGLGKRSTLAKIRKGLLLILKWINVISVWKVHRTQLFSTKKL